MQKPIIRLLLIEDDNDRVELFKSWLPDEFRLVHAGSAGRALGVLQRDRNAYAGLMLDHDLQEQVATQHDLLLSGSDVVSKIIELVRPETPILVHSMNPSDAPRMQKRLESAGFTVNRLPMAAMTEEYFKNWLEDVREYWSDQIAT